MSANPSAIWTFLPGLHGTGDLFYSIEQKLPSSVEAEFISLPNKGKQDYTTLTKHLEETISWEKPRILIAESFSGPLAIRLASLHHEQCQGIILAASFCNAPLNPGIAMLPLRPLFMLKPPRTALEHFLIGEDATDTDIMELRKTISKIPSGTLAKRIRTVLGLQEEDNPCISKLPMLILQAQNDNLIPWEAQNRLVSNYPHATVHWIESPHLILQREAKQCVDYMLEFQQLTSQMEAQHSR